MPRLWTKLLQIAAFVAAVAVLCVIAFSLPPLQTRLTIQVLSVRAGIMQIFSSGPAFSLLQSAPRDVYVGFNEIEFVVPQLATEIRWDPLDGPTHMQARASLSFLSTRVPISPHAVQPTNQIREIRYEDEHVFFDTERGANDPTLSIDLPWQKILHLRLLIIAVITILCGTALLLIRHVKHMPYRFTDSLTSTFFGSALLALVIAAPLIGRVPVAGGEGWDGGVYLNHIRAITQGGPVPHDPYRLLRMGGFPSALIAGGHGFARDTILWVQTISAVLLASAAVSLLFDFLRAMGIGRRVAIISSATFLFSWPLLVMPVFYPMLTDHFAIALTCLAMWVWSRGGTRTLYLLCAWSPWVMPGLFVVPLILAALPRGHLALDHAQGTPSQSGICLALFAMLAPIMAGGALAYIATLSDAEIVTYFAKRNVGAATDLRTWSAAITSLSLVAVAWIWAVVISSEALWRSIQLRPALIATCATALSFVVSAVALEWGSGFTGPAIVWGMFIQSVSAPMKPFVAHVLYFGPVFIFGLLVLFTGSFRSTKTPWPLVGIACAYLPLLAIGSESRQWLPFLPVLVALFALAEQPFRLRVLCLIGGVGLCIPALGLADTVQQAMTAGSDYSTREWQAYFGRQGPWMTATIYQIGLVLTALFAIVGLAIVSTNRREA